MSELPPTPAVPKRRWFRFSLRTLLVVVTVLGCWLGCELNWIRQRHAVLAIGYIRSVKGDPFAKSPGVNADPFSSSPKNVSAPGLLWLFGEPGYSELSFQSLQSFSRTAEAIPAHTPTEVEMIECFQQLFPEAAVYCYWQAEPEPPRPHLPPPRRWSDYDGFKL